MPAEIVKKLLISGDEIHAGDGEIKLRRLKGGTAVMRETRTVIGADVGNRRVTFDGVVAIKIIMTTRFMAIRRRSI